MNIGSFYVINDIRIKKVLYCNKLIDVNVMSNLDPGIYLASITREVKQNVQIIKKYELELDEIPRLFTLLILYLDDYFTLKQEITYWNRWLNLCKKLPMDIQMLVCNIYI